MSINKRTCWRPSLTDITYCSSPGTSVAVWALTNNPFDIWSVFYYYCKECNIYTNSCGQLDTAAEKPQLWGIEDVFSALGSVSVLFVWWFCLFKTASDTPIQEVRGVLLNFELIWFVSIFHPLEYWSCLFCFICFTFTVCLLCFGWCNWGVSMYAVKTGANVPFTV